MISVAHIEGRPVEAARERPVARALDFHAVYREHFDFVWRSCKRMGVSDAALDDATQEVFLVIHRKLGEFEGRSKLKTWIYGIVRNVALRHREKRGRRQKHEAALTLEPSSPHPLPDADLERAQAAALLHALLDELSDDRREVLVLTELEGMTAPEIAEATGVKLNTVYSRLRKARADFESALARHEARRRGGRP